MREVLLNFKMTNYNFKNIEGFLLRRNLLILRYMKLKERRLLLFLSSIKLQEFDRFTYGKLNIRNRISMIN
ncbi:hypothetical protein NPIL_352011 [Nephila pilipes]|uniref:Uncharacterized protein n=1 Tax=Nephila pilipes TaxID=299642 RepID=A0A8X6QVY3_NEPPI|nr:hypothetical protein NPIL_352011 [Nephila pilipes]